MKRIVLLTDFSEESKRAFDKTVELARRLQLGITLVHVVLDLRVPPQGAPLAPPQSDPHLAQDVEEARQQLESIRAEFPSDVDVTYEVLTGEFAARTVAAYASEADVEFIAVSTHGRTGLRRFFLGSVAEEIVRHAPVPVMTFPPA